jgi:PAS domain S-box-containing protein
MAMLFPYFELAASLFILLLAFQIWTRHYENSLARFFAIFAIVAFSAAILEYSCRIAFTLELGRDLDRLCTSLWAFSFAIFAHFVLAMAKKDGFLKKPAALAAFYLPPALLTLLLLFTNIMFLRYEIWSVGIVSMPSRWYSLFSLSNLGYSAIALYVLIGYSLFATQKTERDSSRLIAIGLLIPLIISTVTDEVIPIFYGTRLTPPTAVFGMALMTLFIFAAMRRYSLFAISPALAADTIIETMPDSLLVTDLDGRVLFLNEDAHKFFHAPKEQIAGRQIADLFKQKAKFDQLYSEVVDKKLEVERFQAELIDPLGEVIPALINANLLREKIIGEVLGIVFVVRDIRG